MTKKEPAQPKEARFIPYKTRQLNLFRHFYAFDRSNTAPASRGPARLDIAD